MAYNTARIEALELHNLFEVAEATAITAEERRRAAAPMPGRLPGARRRELAVPFHVFPTDKRVGKRAVNFEPKRWILSSRKRARIKGSHHVAK